jgi:putative spermidine/putrescine transport system permease protein
MPRALSQRLLALAGVLAVIAILGFLVLPAIVVTLAAFNSRSILSFPPETWSLRWSSRRWPTRTSRRASAMA